MKTTKLCMACIVALLALSACTQETSTTATRWTAERANEWYAQMPWLSGADYIPATAINQIEMWSADTYDAGQIDKELGWAKEIGFNTLRVYLSSVVYANDPKGMLERMDHFLSICDKHAIRPLFCIFDDCWNGESSYGTQPAPKPGIHNSGWVSDPSDVLRQDTTTLYPMMERYVKDVLSTFGQDRRVLLWDLWNEPRNDLQAKGATLPHLRKVFEWARQVNPSQPLTAGIWRYREADREVNAFMLEHSDVISYHCYAPINEMESLVKFLKMFNRPIICTEYMARTKGSTFQSIMPMLKANGVAAINWGFVAGKTNTIFAWDTPLPNTAEPEVWFHDIFRADGTPYSQEEIDTIKSLNNK